MSHIELTWEPLDSSHISAMAYNEPEAQLLIQYNTGAVYSVDANEEEAQGLRTAASPGRYVNLMFKGRLSRVS